MYNVSIIIKFIIDYSNRNYKHLSNYDKTELYFGMKIVGTVQTY